MRNVKICACRNTPLDTLILIVYITLSIKRYIILYTRCERNGKTLFINCKIFIEKYNY